MLKDCTANEKQININNNKGAILHKWSAHIMFTNGTRKPQLKRFLSATNSALRRGELTMELVKLTTDGTSSKSSISSVHHSNGEQYTMEELFNDPLVVQCAEQLWSRVKGSGILVELTKVTSQEPSVDDPSPAERVEVEETFSDSDNYATKKCYQEELLVFVENAYTEILKYNFVVVLYKPSKYRSDLLVPIQVPLEYVNVYRIKPKYFHSRHEEEMIAVGKEMGDISDMGIDELPKHTPYHVYSASRAQRSEKSTVELCADSIREIRFTQGLIAQHISNDGARQIYLQKKALSPTEVDAYGQDLMIGNTCTPITQREIFSTDVERMKFEQEKLTGAVDNMEAKNSIRREFQAALERTKDDADDCNLVGCDGRKRRSPYCGSLVDENRKAKKRLTQGTSWMVLPRGMEVVERLTQENRAQEIVPVLEQHIEYHANIVRGLFLLGDVGNNVYSGASKSGGGSLFGKTRAQNIQDTQSEDRIARAIQGKLLRVLQCALKIREEAQEIVLANDDLQRETKDDGGITLKQDDFHDSLVDEFAARILDDRRIEDLSPDEILFMDRLVERYRVHLRQPVTSRWNIEFVGSSTITYQQLMELLNNNRIDVSAARKILSEKFNINAAHFLPTKAEPQVETSPPVAKDNEDLLFDQEQQEEDITQPSFQ